MAWAGLENRSARLASHVSRTRPNAVLEADPRQQPNIFSDHPEVVKELEIELARYREAIPDTKPLGWINLKQ